MFREVKRDFQEMVGEAQRTIQRVVWVKEVGMRLNPRHPMYISNLRRALLPRVLAVSLSLPALIGTTVYDLGWSGRSAKRAHDICDMVGCREDAVALFAQLGISPEEYFRKFPHPSFPEIKSSMDRYYRRSDFIPMVGFTSLSLIASLVSATSLGTLLRTDRAWKRTFFDKKASD